MKTQVSNLVLEGVFRSIDTDKGGTISLDELEEFIASDDAV